MKQESKPGVDALRIEVLKTALFEADERVAELFELCYLQYEIWVDSGINGVRGDFSKELHDKIELALNASPKKLRKMNQKYKEKPWRSASSHWTRTGTQKKNPKKRKSPTSSRTSRR